MHKDKNSKNENNKKKSVIGIAQLCLSALLKINKSCEDFCSTWKWSSSARHARYRNSSCINNQLQHNRHANKKWQTYSEIEGECQYTNNTQETDKPDKCNTNITAIKMDISFNGTFLLEMKPHSKPY